MTKKQPPPSKEGRTFGFTMGIVLGLVGGVVWLWAYHAAVEGDLARGSRYAAWAWGAWVAAVVLALAAGAVPGWLVPVNKAWMALAEGIGFVMSRVVLGVTYFAILTPIALIRRLRGADPLQPHFDPERESYWEPREPDTFDAKRYERQY